MTRSSTLRNRSLSLGAAGLALAGALTFSADAPATPPKSQRYMVTVTNVTRGQIFSPAFAVSHSDAASLFELGQPASAGLALIAEEGDASQLAAMMSANSEVTDVRVDANGALMPGQTTTVIVSARPTDLISVAGMMVSTNDAFFAVRGVPTPLHGEEVVRAAAYDAGSEANSEDCAYIPGPPCGNSAHDPNPAEGYVHVHAGVHGGAGLDPAQFDWRGDVAEIRIERM